MSGKTTAKTSSTAPQQFTAEERAAMKARAKELKANADKAEAAAEVDAKIAEMPEADRVLAERIHAIVASSAPELSPKTWYGMPAYANADGKNVCFFKPASKFKARYATLGFNDAAKLDDGNMWATEFALTTLTDADEQRIASLVKKAAG